MSQEFDIDSCVLPPTMDISFIHHRIISLTVQFSNQYHAATRTRPGSSVLDVENSWESMGKFMGKHFHDSVLHSRLRSPRGEPATKERIFKIAELGAHTTGAFKNAAFVSSLVAPQARMTPKGRNPTRLARDGMVARDGDSRN